MVYNRIVTIPFVIYPHRYRCEQIQTILYTYTFDHSTPILPLASFHSISGWIMSYSWYIYPVSIFSCLWDWHAVRLGYLIFRLFCWLGAGHNYRGDSAWVALLCRARSRFAKPRSAHIAHQKGKNSFSCASGDGLREPKQQCTSGLALPLYQMRAPIIRAKKAKNLRYP